MTVSEAPSNPSVVVAAYARLVVVLFAVAAIIVASVTVTTKLNAIEEVTKDSHYTAVLLQCAVTNGQAHPEWAAPGNQPGEAEALDLCIAEGTR